MKPLTIAINKGRILREVMPLFSKAEIVPVESVQHSRKLVFETSDSGIRLVVMRGADVPVFVEHGAADIGIVGKDTLLEFPGREYYEKLDLGIACCRLMTAAPEGYVPVQGVLRVATKFVQTAHQYFAAQHRQVDIIRLSGALEIAPQMGLADQIVDIVDSGNTLRANGLVALETIADISTRLIVNRATLKIRFQDVEEVVGRIALAADALRSAERTDL